MKTYYVYIMANQKPVLYIGVTNDLVRRVAEHKTGSLNSFTKEFGLKKLVYFEESSRIEDAIAREKQLKNWHRAWKLNLIRENNPGFDDLSALWLESDPETSSG